MLMMDAATFNVASGTKRFEAVASAHKAGNITYEQLAFLMNNLTKLLTLTLQSVLAKRPADGGSRDDGVKKPRSVDARVNRRKDDARRDVKAAVKEIERVSARYPNKIDKILAYVKELLDNPEFLAERARAAKEDLDAIQMAVTRTGDPELDAVMFAQVRLGSVFNLPKMHCKFLPESDRPDYCVPSSGAMAAVSHVFWYTGCTITATGIHFDECVLRRTIDEHHAAGSRYKACTIKPGKPAIMFLHYDDALSSVNCMIGLREGDGRIHGSSEKLRGEAWTKQFIFEPIPVEVTVQRAAFVSGAGRLLRSIGLAQADTDNMAVAIDWNAAKVQVIDAVNGTVITEAAFVLMFACDIAKAMRVQVE
jgi:hypothetical protein